MINIKSFTNNEKHIGDYELDGDLKVDVHNADLYNGTSVSICIADLLLLNEKQSYEKQSYEWLYRITKSLELSVYTILYKQVLRLDLDESELKNTLI